jgi:hypothetical protein
MFPSILKIANCWKKRWPAPATRWTSSLAARQQTFISISSKATPRFFEQRFRVLAHFESYRRSPANALNLVEEPKRIESLIFRHLGN